MHQHHSSFNFSLLVPFIIITLLLFTYIIGVVQLKKVNKDWNKWRTISFIIGLGVLAVAFLPATMQYAHTDFRGHMLQHLLIGMLAPIGLVLGAPVTLLLKAIPHQKGKSVSAFFGSRFFHFISHPISALVLNIGGMFILYLTPLYNATFNYPFLHHFIHIHFLLAGYLFTWSIIGPDPAPARPGLKLRCFVLFLSMALHSFLSKLMYAYLLPANSPHSVEEIRAGAKFMYYGGDATELLIVIALFALWYRKRGKSGYKLSPFLN